MIRFPKALSTLGLAAVLTGGLTPHSDVRADEPAEIVVSDHRPSGSVPSGTISSTGKYHRYEHGGYSTIDSGPHSPDRRAPSPTYVWLAGDGSHSYPADYGWTRPIKYPIGRDYYNVYQRYYPNYWHGQAFPPGKHWNPVFPVIYTPTDTTQLGYTYQHVPTWQPRPNMVPPPVNPTRWHHREGPLGYRGGYGSISSVGNGVSSSPGRVYREGEIINERIINERVIERGPAPGKPTPVEVLPEESAQDLFETDSLLPQPAPAVAPSRPNTDPI